MNGQEGELHPERRSQRWGEDRPALLTSAPLPVFRTNLDAVNVAPCGSEITVIRTHGASNGGTTTERS